MFGLRQKPVKFPTKKGIDAIACVSLLDLYGSLFCLDNFNILFYKDGVPKVLKPVKIEPANQNLYRDDFDAFPLGEYFAIKYGDNVYCYHACFEVVTTLANEYIKITDVKQDVYSTELVNGELQTLDKV